MRLDRQVYRWEGYRVPLLEEAQAMQDRVYERLTTDHSPEEFLPTPPTRAINTLTIIAVAR